MMALRVLILSLWCDNLFASSTGSFTVDENNRVGNNVTLSCSGLIDTVHNAQWWFNSTPIAESTCYMNFTRPTPQFIKLQVSPECEGDIYCAEKATLTNISEPRPLYGKVSC